MRIALCLSLFAFVSALHGAQAEKVPAPAPPANKLDPKALDLVKQAAAVFPKAKSLHVEVAIATKIVGDDKTKEIKSKAVYDFVRPNLYSVRAQLDGDPNVGPEIVCDGKKLFVHAKRLKQFIEYDAPDDLDGLGSVHHRFGNLSTTGLLFQNVLNDDPYDTLIEGVASANYEGKVKLDGIECHHLKFMQPGLSWELWTAAEGIPLVRKVATTVPGDAGTMTTVETFQNWKLDQAPEKSVFAFAAPDGVKKVKLFKK